MMSTRVNINVPMALFKQANMLVQKGYFSNFSEIVREGLREELRKYEEKFSSFSEDERKLFALLKDVESKGLLLNEKEMKKHGLTV